MSHRDTKYLSRNVIYVTLSNMTSAAPLSVVLTLFSKRKEGKEGVAEVMFEKVTEII